MPRGHKYIKKYRNSHGNWTYVYDEPKDRTQVAPNVTPGTASLNSGNNSGIDSVSWTGAHDATYHMSSNPNWHMTARDRRTPYYLQDPSSGIGVRRRGHGLNSSVSQQGVRRKQYHSVQEFIADAWKKRLRKKRKDDYEQAVIDHVFAQIAEDRKKYPKQKVTAKHAQRKKKEVADRVERRRKKMDQMRYNFMSPQMRRLYKAAKKKDRETIYTIDSF